MIKVYTDASVRIDKVYQSAGWGVVIVGDEKNDEWFSRSGRFTNMPPDISLAEAMAAVNGLSWGVKKGIIAPASTVRIFTDNKTAGAVVLGQHRYKDEYKREHADFIYQVATQIILKAQLRVDWKHVKAHTGKSTAAALANQEADRLSKKARKRHEKKQH